MLTGLKNKDYWAWVLKQFNVFRGHSWVSSCRGLLGWPKSSIWFFCNILWKNQNELFGQPNTSGLIQRASGTYSGSRRNHVDSSEYKRIASNKMQAGRGGKRGGKRTTGDRRPPSDVELRNVCTIVISKQMGRWTIILKTEDIPPRGRRGSGPQNSAPG